MDNNSSDNEENCVYKTTKKRKSHGRMLEVLKKLRLSSHEAGPACDCRLGCFERLLSKQEHKFSRILIYCRHMMPKIAI